MTPERPLSDTKSIRILVVDDEPKICEFLGVLLGREGYTVDSALDGASALERLRGNAYDLVISDLKMPAMDGFELARRIREMDESLPFIVMTGFATLGTAVEAMRQGVDDYITKPFKLEEMRKVVSRVLAKARLAVENRRLIAQLEAANAELGRHRGRLQREVETASESLRRANERLRRKVEELAMLNEVATAAASESDLDRLLMNTLRLVREKLACTRASAMLTRNGSLVVRACDGADEGRTLGQERRLGQGIAGYVAKTGEAVLVEDIRRDKRFTPHAEWGYATRSLVCVPVRFKQTLLGVICVTDKTDGRPFVEHDLRLLSTIANQVAPAIANARFLETIEENAFRAVCALVVALEARDRYTSGHSDRVSRYAVATGRALGISRKDLHTLARAAQLHDLGKLGVSDSILNKPASLSHDEYDLIREHPVLGEQIISPLQFLSGVGAAVRDHHERPDGKGYPDGKRGRQINRLARILSVADAFDAMTTARPYRPAKSVEEARAEIVSLRGLQFDPEVADVFCETAMPQVLEGPPPT